MKKLILKWSLLIAGCTLFILGLTILVSRCQSNKQEKKVIEAVKKVEKAVIIDSVLTDKFKDSIYYLNQKLAKRELIINNQARQITGISNKLDKAIENYRNDTTHTLEADNMANVSKQYQDSTKQHIDSLTSQIEQQKQKAQIALNLADQKTKFASVIQTQFKELEKKSNLTWMQKNEKYIALFFGGLIGGYVGYSLR